MLDWPIVSQIVNNALLSACYWTLNGANLLTVSVLVKREASKSPATLAVLCNCTHCGQTGLVSLGRQPV